MIASSGTYGVWLSDTNTSGNLVQGNIIGADITRTNPLGSGFANVELQSGASGNVIGGTSPGAANVIAFSGGSGVLVYDPGSTGNSIRGNSIFGNSGIGINLVGGTEDGFGVTANHPGGAVPGPNDLQNYPVLSAATVSGATTTVAGSLNSTAGRSFFIDIYRNSAPDPSGHGQGQVYVGSASMTTDGSGNGNFALLAPGNFLGQSFSATATDAATGDTSEFSSDLPAAAGPAPIAFEGPFVQNGSGFAFNLALQSYASYRIQSATNLSAPVWVNLTNFVPTTSPFQFTDRTATNVPVRFYRVVSP